MDLEDIDTELASDRPEVQAAVKRGITAAYGSLSAAEDEYSGHVMEVIEAVRAAVLPLL
jgi:hypothetical protein